MLKRVATVTTPQGPQIMLNAERTSEELENDFYLVICYSASWNRHVGNFNWYFNHSCLSGAQRAGLSAGVRFE